MRTPSRLPLSPLAAAPCLALCLALAALAAPAGAGEFVSSLPAGVERHWIGPEYWSNPLQDWRLANGRLECIVSGGDRNVALLTAALEPGAGPLEAAVTFGVLEGESFEPAAGWVGMRLGARGEFDDPRDDALRGAGLDLGVTADGRLFVGRVAADAPTLSARLAPIELRVRFEPAGDALRAELAALDAAGRTLASLSVGRVHPDWLVGGLALVASATPPVEVDPAAPRPASRPAPKTPRGGDVRVWFADWQVTGARLALHPERSFGPILFAQHTLSRGVLRLNAQMAAVELPPGQIGLEVRGPRDDGWRWMGTATIDPRSYTATWRVEGWDDTRDWDYRLLCGYRGQLGEPVRYEFAGTIRKDPRDAGELVVAAFTGNNDLGFPHQDLVAHVAAHDPDLLVFTGDQLYESVGGFGVQREPLEAALLDYLRKWTLFGWEYRDLLRDRPSLCLPDDHDVYHGNLWGAGGKAADGRGMKGQDSGGYTMPPEFVNAVQYTQTLHHPDAYDATHVEQGIEVYYGELLYGGVSFAVIEDRKWKSAPAVVLPEAAIQNGWSKNPDYDARTQGDVPGAELLGARQLAFLDDWVGDWSGGAWMKVCVSQTIFANVATLPPPADTDAVTPRLRVMQPDEYPDGEVPVQDHDSNGWPQSGRDAALRRLRKGFALHVAGDQHLGSTVHYGVDDWNDAGWAICVPSVANFWPRRWYPDAPGANRAAGAPRETGEFLDGFGNKVTVAAVSNPIARGVAPAKLHDRAPGYGIVRLSRADRRIELANWPRHVDPSAPDARPYAGWPVVVDQLDNYGRARTGWLPRLEVEGLAEPVVRVLRADGELVYALRATGPRFDPFVFEDGEYAVEVGDPDGPGLRRLDGLRPAPAPGAEVLRVDFDAEERR